MLPANPNNNYSILEFAKLLEQQAGHDVSQWKPKGFINYASIVGSLTRFLYKKAQERLTADQYSRIIIKANVERNTGNIFVEVTEKQIRLPVYVETRLALRPCSAIVVYCGTTKIY